MHCNELAPRFEVIAAGDDVPTPEESVHLGACRHCSARLEAARLIDAGLRARPALPAPAGFTAAVVARVRLERWRAERAVDVGFNLAIGAGLLLAVGGFLLLVNAFGLAPMARDASLLFGRGVMLLMDRAAAALPTYLGAIALLGAGLAAWWWADQRAAL
jgi:hypothetical protein